MFIDITTAAVRVGTTVRFAPAPYRVMRITAHAAPGGLEIALRPELASGALGPETLRLFLRADIANDELAGSTRDDLRRALRLATTADRATREAAFRQLEAAGMGITFQSGTPDETLYLTAAGRILRDELS